MKIAGKPVRKRIGAALAVFLVFLAFASVRGTSDPVRLVSVPIAFFAAMIAIDAARERFDR